MVYHQVDMGRKDPETGKAWFSKRIGPGFPDLVLIKGKRILFWELKTEKGKVFPNQQAWINALQEAGQEAEVMRPRDRDRMEAILQGD